MVDDVAIPVSTLLSTLLSTLVLDVDVDAHVECRLSAHQASLSLPLSLPRSDFCWRHSCSAFTLLPSFPTERSPTAPTEITRGHGRVSGTNNFNTS
mmetsp:Transcript_6620/g.25559  ORF Transcript_6620/g.25559 Transcript_6620/m.25559 type:complete len:96 (+) Transcript_6620:392-679(+)